MDNFTFHVPTRFVFGRDAELSAGRELSALGCRRVLLHYGGGSCVRSGLLARLQASLDEAGVAHVELGGVRPNPRLGLVREGIALARAGKVDGILAVGGGSVIDSSKAIACGAPDSGDVWDFFSGLRKASVALPLGCVLTIAAAGSESSDACVLTREEDCRKRSTHSPLVVPRFAILDPALTMTLPAFQTACGATDMMAHVLERYFSRTEGVEITDRLCEAILLTVLHELPRVLANPSDYDARANLMWSATIAHNNTCGMGRVQDWGSHALEHELSGLYDCAHGAGLAVIFPAWITYAVEKGGGAAKAAQLARRVFGVGEGLPDREAALLGVDALRRFLEECGMPVDFAGLGAREEDIPRLVDMLEPERRTIGRFVRIDRQAATDIYRLCLHPAPRAPQRD